MLQPVGSGFSTTYRALYWAPVLKTLCETLSEENSSKNVCANLEAQPLGSGEGKSSHHASTLSQKYKIQNYLTGSIWNWVICDRRGAVHPLDLARRVAQFPM